MTTARKATVLEQIYPLVTPGADANAPDDQLPQGGSSRHRFFSDGKRLASAGEDGTLRLWDVATGKELRQHAAERATTLDGLSAAVIFSPDGGTLAASFPAMLSDGPVRTAE